MSDAVLDDLPSQLTSLLRNVPGVHTVYATKPIVPTLVTAVVELVKNDPVGLHLVTIAETDDGFEVETCIGIADDEPAPDICRRAHDALYDFFANIGTAAPERIIVRIGRVG
jgi:hypothetical protein